MSKRFTIVTVASSDIGPELAVTCAQEGFDLSANARHGLGRGFLNQDFADLRHVVATNVTGTGSAGKANG